MWAFGGATGGAAAGAGAQSALSSGALTSLLSQSKGGGAAAPPLSPPEMMKVDTLAPITPARSHVDILQKRSNAVELDELARLLSSMRGPS